MVPDIRISVLNPHPVRVDGDYVLYWMTSARRASWNFALDRAREHADALGKPILVFEALRADYQWASDRFHQFVIDGMRDNQRAFHKAGVLYYPYVEPSPGEGRGLLHTLSEKASVVVTDDFPSFFLPKMTAAAAAQLRVRLESVDGNGLLPLRVLSSTFTTAHAFRRALQQVLPRHLNDRPHRVALTGVARVQRQLPAEATRRWPPAFEWLDHAGLEHLPIDHGVGAVPIRGGEQAGRERLREFLASGLASYGERNHPDDDRSSRLSPYLHWGHLSAHEVFDAVGSREGWLGLLPAKATGAREGWRGLSQAAERYLDELVTWRELGYNMCATRSDYSAFDSLPSWALTTLGKHERDDGQWVYTPADFEQARTHDPLWNAAQRQLRTEGRIHNYLRMLWGKKILEWSSTPRDALGTMIELNNKYALDGRDPNSYSGIFWVLGRYDRPWFPERPVLGTIRYMSSDNTMRKLHVREYLRRYAG